MQEARSKGNAIVEQHKKALTHVFEQHKAEALIQADTRIKAEKTSVKQQLGMANSKAALELKRELGAAQKRLKKQLFKEVEEKLSAYMKTEKYQDLLDKGATEEEAFEIVKRSVGDVERLIQEINEPDATSKAAMEQRRKKSAFRIAIAVGLYILSPVAII